jgi:multidrug efflux pump subunit AcrA (membrane-fusion protein)
MAFVKRKYIWILATLFVLGSVLIVVAKSGLTSANLHTVQSGSFELAINIKGEVQGKNAIVINLPDELKKRELRIHGLKIKDMVQEGTIVKKGEWVATLDAGTINQRIQSNNQELTKYRAELNDAKIDSAIQLTKLREELQEFKYDLEYEELELEQAKYESPAYQRKKQVEFNKIIRQMEKKRRDYELKKIDLKRRTRRTEDRFKRYSRSDSLFKAGLKACRVKAPKDGMVMYAKLWGGRKLRIGDEISPWNPIIATLPDMSVLVSETYVPEIDITKIAVGDSVEINIDALPNKKYSGVISKIANIGQELQGFDSKVFKVLIDMNENGEEIKPSMTTDNKIILKNYAEVIKIPREYLFSANGETFVYLKKDGKIWKRKIVAGLENEEETVITSGLQKKDRIYTLIPEEVENITFIAE